MNYANHTLLRSGQTYGAGAPWGGFVKADGTPMLAADGKVTKQTLRHPSHKNVGCTEWL